MYILYISTTELIFMMHKQYMGHSTLFQYNLVGI